MSGRTGAGVAGATGVTGLTTGTGTGGFGGMILSTICTTTIPRSDGAARSGRPAGINSNSRTATLRAIAPADRKSVVKGKSVSVRVDLGVSRIIKKTIEQQPHTEAKTKKQ